MTPIDKFPEEEARARGGEIDGRIYWFLGIGICSAAIAIWIVWDWENILHGGFHSDRIWAYKRNFFLEIAIFQTAFFLILLLARFFESRINHSLLNLTVWTNVAGFIFWSLFDLEILEGFGYYFNEQPVGVFIAILIM